jgi:hypothetical protein
MFPSFFPTNTGQTAQSDVDGWITPFLTFVEDVFILVSDTPLKPKDYAKSS